MKTLIILSFLSVYIYIDAAAHSKYILIKKESDIIDSLVITEKRGVSGSTMEKELSIYENKKKIYTIEIPYHFFQKRYGENVEFSLYGFGDIFPIDKYNITTNSFSLSYGFYIGSTYYSEIQLIYQLEANNDSWVLAYIRESERRRIFDEENQNEVLGLDPNEKILSWRKPIIKTALLSKKSLNLKTTKNMTFIPVLDFNQKIRREFRQNNFSYFQNKFSQLSIDSLVCLYQRTPDSIEFFNNLGYYLEELNLNKEAIYLLNIVIGFDKFRTVAYLNLGDAYWAVKDFAKAKEMYKIYQTQMINNRSEDRIPNRVLKRL